MPKILSDIKKIEIAEAFKSGSTLEELSNQYGLNKYTITKYLKKILSELEYKRILKLKRHKNFNKESSENELVKTSNYKNNNEKVDFNNSGKFFNSSIEDANFIEIPPLSQAIDLEKQIDLTSKPLKEFTFPEDIFMIIDKNIELEITLIKDYPEYSFLSESDQKRKIIKLFSNKKSASLFCSKTQKVIKVPNGGVLSLAAPFLLKKGITRIIYDDYLLSI